MPDLGPMGRGGARRRTRRRMMAMNEMQKSQDQHEAKPDEIIATDVYSEKLEKLAKLLKDKGVISAEEYDSIFE